MGRGWEILGKEVAQLRGKALQQEARLAFGAGAAGGGMGLTKLRPRQFQSLLPIDRGTDTLRGGPA